MTGRPIIFSAPMVLALLNGRKTQTRRVLKPQPVLNVSGLWVWPPDWVNGAKRGVVCVQTDYDGLKQSLEYDPSRTLRYAPGDRLWVREAWRIGAWDHERGKMCIDFKADGAADPVWRDVPDPDWFEEQWIGISNELQDKSVRLDADGHYVWRRGESPLRWRSPIHMPRWASRMTLLVTDVRVQRVQEISEADARAEGLATVTKDGRLWKWGIPDRDGVPGNDDHGWNWTDWETDPRKSFTRLWNSIHGPDAWDRNDWVVVVTFTVEQRNIDA